MKNRLFLKLEFNGLLMPLYIKVCGIDSLCGELSFKVLGEHGDKVNLKFVTGRFPHKNEQPYFSVISIGKNKYGCHVVEIETAHHALKDFSVVYMDEEGDAVVWSRKYYSESFHFSYVEEEQA